MRQMKNKTEESHESLGQSTDMQIKKEINKTPINDSQKGTPR